MDNSRVRNVKHWAVGITTAPRKKSTLLQTLDSLKAAGWDSPRLFAEPGVEIPFEFNRLPVSRRDETLGAFPNWYLALTELVLRNPRAEAFLLCQDDVLFTSDIRDYLEHSLWPAKQVGVVSIYCPSHYPQTEKPGFIREDRGWKSWGALAYIFSNPAARAILSDSMVLNHRDFGPAEGLHHIDSVVGYWCERNQLSYFVHSPSLAQHIGDSSTIYPRANASGNRQAKDFRDQFNLKLNSARTTNVSEQLSFESNMRPPKSRNGFTPLKAPTLIQDKVSPTETNPSNNQNERIGRSIPKVFSPVKPQTKQKTYSCDVILPYSQPNYRYLEDSIKSVLNQNFVITTIHLINDGVNEDPIGAKYSRLSNVRWYKNTDQPVGPYITYNRLFDYLEHDIIANQDSDDLSLPMRLYKSIQLIEQGYDIVGGSMEQFVTYDDSSKRMWQALSKKPYHHSGIYYAASPSGSVVNSTAVMKKSVYEACNGMAPWIAGADSEFYERCIQAGFKAAAMQDVIALRRLHNPSLSNDQVNSGHGSNLREEIKKMTAESIARQKLGSDHSIGGLSKHRNDKELTQIKGK
ncbi:glycosyltransferase [Gimesia fumaroli]|uniref:Glycosyl transferase family 2 n=1 Tax=Gimesia fumaroli TaxID=2527976 RepID=A0A518IGH1_9PLAN|nr:glycosyltransferase [Gimesia fumaroli]QDV52190.1 Glycosyl transferase family 2 [Gimesia fumaroli]